MMDGDSSVLILAYDPDFDSSVQQFRMLMLSSQHAAKKLTLLWTLFEQHVISTILQTDTGY